jgi:hypothetical protein
MGRQWALTSGSRKPLHEAETAVLSVVAEEARKHGACTLTVGHMAALAGVSEARLAH